LRHRVLRILIRDHGHECEAARFAGELILNQHHFFHGSHRAEEILEFGFRGVEREVPHVEFITHLD
jgi:hypothetical protein